MAGVPGQRCLGAGLAGCEGQPPSTIQLSWSRRLPPRRLSTPYQNLHKTTTTPAPTLTINSKLRHPLIYFDTAMLALRDQENLVHAHQTTAAGKPLNQNIRGLQPKTPGNLKTPFRPSRNDENRPLTLKNGPSKLDKNAFVTPLGEMALKPPDYNY